MDTPLRAARTSALTVGNQLPPIELHVLFLVEAAQPVTHPAEPGKSSGCCVQCTPVGPLHGERTVMFS
jgi:hypothetical protein